MKKFVLYFIGIFILCSMAMSAFAVNNVTIGKLGISVKKDRVIVNASVDGYVDNIPFSVKCLSKSGEVEYVDYVYASYGFINTSFVPAKAQKGDELILKITGVTTVTGTFVYSEENTTDIPLTDAQNDILESISGTYSAYEDMIGTLGFQFDISGTSSVTRITMRGNFSADNTIWQNKDPERWNSYLYTIADVALRRANKDVRINVFDSNKKLIDNKFFGSNGDWGQDIPKMIKTLNTKYNKMTIGNKTYTVRYSRGDVDVEFNTGDVLFLDTVVRNIDFTTLKDEERTQIQEFFDDVYNFSKEECSYDTTFRVYNSGKKLFQNYTYFSEYSLKDKLYWPLNQKGSFPVELMDYGNNSVLIPTSAISLSSKSGYYEATVSDSTTVVKAMGALKNDEPCQVVFGLNPLYDTNKIKMNVSSGVLRVLSAKKAMLTLNNPLMQLNIDTSNIPTSSSISLIIERTVDEFNINKLVSDYIKVSLVDGDGNELNLDGAIGVFRFSDEYSGYITDIRKINIAYSNSSDFTESVDFHGTYDSGLLGMRFIYNNGGYYRAYQADPYFNDIKDHWAQDAILVLASKDILNGVGNGMFMPTTTITRSEFVATIVRHLGLEKVTTNYYSDVDMSSWYGGEVNAAKTANILPPTMMENEFKPLEVITREEMAYITVKAYMLCMGERVVPSTLLFDDADQVSSWAYDSISIAQEKKIMNGNEKNECNPQGSATRGEAAQIIYNLLVAEKLF